MVHAKEGGAATWLATTPRVWRLADYEQTQIISWSCNSIRLTMKVHSS
ncbi:hypothetical protein STTU_p0090 (plasmid) [Streptomyces sp. Tu6071]|nr:hypothetical protein STTU_p0090 [Streptomyces sp. Tu6071]